MSDQSHTPGSVHILPRNRHHEIAECLGRDWYDDHPFKTAWFNAMSITFPLGEKFFIDSVRHYQDQINDPKLLEEIRGFCGQEGFHRREHDAYNRELCRRRGYDFEFLEGRIEKNIALTYKWFTPLQCLASTAALEHLTAIMAESFLDEQRPVGAGAEPPMRELWDWHAAEEMEHKAVAFDVFIAVGGTEKMRRRALREATLFLAWDILVGIVHMLRRDGKLWSFKVWREGMSFLFNKDAGILRRLWPAYKSWYREGFHPWQRDTQHLLEKWKSSQADLAA